MQTAPGASLTDASTQQDRHDRARLVLALTVVAVVIYAADQVTKVLAVSHLTPGVPVDVVGSWLRLTLTRNPGAAFSLATGMTWLLTLIALSVVVVVVRSARRLGSRGWTLAFGLLLGGALGNLTDRLLRAPGIARGHVVDFVQLPHWPIFNVADAAIVSAAVLSAILAVRGVGVDGRREAAHLRG